MAARNVDSITWPLDTSVRIALFVPTTPDGELVCGQARSVYYCPSVHGAIGGLTFELYALLETWVDTLRLARYIHNSYTFVTRNDKSLSTVLRAGLPSTDTYADDSALCVGVDECYDVDDVPPHPNDTNGADMEYDAPRDESVEADEDGTALFTMPPASQRQQQRTTRLVRIHTDNHHVLQYMVRMWGKRDALELKVGKEVEKRSAAFALLYMHHPLRVHAPAAAAAEAAAARKKKKNTTPKGTKGDTASMFRGSRQNTDAALQHRVQHVLAWDKGGALQGTQRPNDTDVLRVMQREQKEADETRLRAKESAKQNAAAGSDAKEHKQARKNNNGLPHLRLVRTTSGQAIFLQQVSHIKIDAFVHEHERGMAERRAAFAAEARTLVAGYTEVQAATTSAVGMLETAVEKRERHANTLAFTRASTLVVHVPARAAEQAWGQLTGGPVPPPDTKSTYDEMRRAFGTRPLILETDVFDPGTVHWITTLQRVTLSRELGGRLAKKRPLTPDATDDRPLLPLAKRPKRDEEELPPLDLTLFGDLF